MTDYFLGMIWLDPMFMIPDDPSEALKYIKECRKSALEKTIEAMEDSPYYFKASDFELPN